MARVEELQREIETLEIRLTSTNEAVDFLLDQVAKLTQLLRTIAEGMREIAGHEAPQPRNGEDKA